jgi:hypothetical protein
MTTWLRPGLHRQWTKMCCCLFCHVDGSIPARWSLFSIAVFNRSLLLLHHCFIVYVNSQQILTGIDSSRYRRQYGGSIIQNCSEYMQVRKENSGKCSLELSPQSLGTWRKEGRKAAAKHLHVWDTWSSVRRFRDCLKCLRITTNRGPFICAYRSVLLCWKLPKEALERGVDSSPFRFISHPGREQPGT